MPAAKTGTCPKGAARRRSPAVPRRPGPVPVAGLALFLAFPLQAQSPRRAAAPATREIVVTPAAAAVEVGRAVQLRAVVLGARGDTLRTGVRWTSSDTVRARVSDAGLVAARDTGVVTITAAADRWRGTARLTLRPAILVGAGDIGECGLPGAAQTGRLLDSIPGTVFTAGDNAYPNGTRAQFAACYDPAWGRQKARTRPTPGNHDYRVPGAASYFDYFGSLAGERGRGWYAYDLGGWRVYALNSNVADGIGSEQETWLRADLAAHPTRCAVAIWHHPRFSSGPHGTSPSPGALYRALYDAGAEVVVSGHDHIYERFAPQAPDGRADAARGLRQFVVGTGGGPLYDLRDPQPNSEFRYNAGYGVLKLTLYPRGYTWRFLGVTGGRVLDSGSGVCH